MSATNTNDNTKITHRCKEAQSWLFFQDGFPSEYDTIDTYTTK